VLLVPNTTEALGKLGGVWRGRTKARVVAVTGSAGKTSVKEMLASILSQELRTAKNYKNFNNQIGVPLSILATSGDEDVLVLELGINQPGDMDELGAICTPDMVVITNVGPAHLEGLESVEGVARAKAAVLRYLRPLGQAVVSADYRELRREAGKLVRGMRTFSARGNEAAFQCSFLGPAPGGGGNFLILLEGKPLEVALPFCGSHFAENVVAAASAAYVFGASFTAIRQGLQQAHLPEQRFNCRVSGSLTLIDDTYNANPLSMRRAIQAAGEMARDKPLRLVLGEMLELGEQAARAHRELGEVAAEAGADTVFYKGGHEDALRAGLETGGFSGDFIGLENPEEFVAAWESMPGAQNGGVVLFKGSRSTRMEAYYSELARKIRATPGEEKTG
jgi:UDP-N-acetylmuramoyl-tripeptide--D-alanyl-D-alanine ligase